MGSSLKILRQDELQSRIPYSAKLSIDCECRVLFLDVRDLKKWLFCVLSLRTLPRECAPLKRGISSMLYMRLVKEVNPSSHEKQFFSTSISLIFCLYRWFVDLLLLFRGSVVSDFLGPQELQQASLPCPSTSPGVCSNSCPLSQWCYSTISSSVALFSLAFNFSQLQGLFPMSQLFVSVVRVLELQLQHQSFQWIFGVDFF